MKIHLIVSTDKNLKVYDWTPFYNKKSSSNIINIIEKDNLISHALDGLNLEGWHVKSTFNDNKYFYFLLVKNIVTEQKYSLLNNSSANNKSANNKSADNESADNESADNELADNELEDNESDNRKMSHYVNITPNSSDEELDFNYLTIDSTNN